MASALELGPRVRLVLTAAVALSSSACLDPVTPLTTQIDCKLDSRYLVEGGLGRRQISALNNAWAIDAGSADESPQLADTSRVVGFVVDKRPYAVPHNVLWRHEIVNMNVGAKQIAITYAPLSGSSLGFDRASVQGAALEVAGLLYKNNLMVYDKAESASLWPQMSDVAACGPHIGNAITRIPVLDIQWGSWKQLYPMTMVITTFGGASGVYPYGDYELREEFYYPSAMPPLDFRRPVKERVLGLPPAGNDPGLALPFGALQAVEGPFAVVRGTYRGEPAVVFWSDVGAGGMAYRPTIEGEQLTFRATTAGFVDASGSLWDVTGRAVTGPRSGSVLPPIAEAHVAFWGVWAAFHPDMKLWIGG